MVLLCSLICMFIMTYEVKCLCCCSVPKVCLTLCNPMDCSSQASLSFTISQTHVHSVGDAIQPSQSSVTPFSSCPQSFPASGSFPMSWLFASGGQSIGASASVSVLPMNIQDGFPLRLISLLSKGLWRIFSSTTIRKHQFFGTQPALWSNSLIPKWLLENP